LPDAVGRLAGEGPGRALVGVHLPVAADEWSALSHGILSRSESVCGGPICGYACPDCVRPEKDDDDCCSHYRRRARGGDTRDPAAEVRPAGGSPDPGEGTLPARAHR